MLKLKLYGTIVAKGEGDLGGGGILKIGKKEKGKEKRVWEVG